MKLGKIKLRPKTSNQRSNSKRTEIFRKKKRKPLHAQSFKEIYSDFKNTNKRIWSSYDESFLPSKKREDIRSYLLKAKARKRITKEKASFLGTKKNFNNFVKKKIGEKDEDAVLIKNFEDKMDFGKFSGESYQNEKYLRQILGHKERIECNDLKLKYLR